MKLSALLVVHNEEGILETCLNKLDFCDQIVVVLDKCTDSSKDIAKRFNCEIYEGAWDIEGDRRNFGINKCKGEWILEVDADEHISKKLAEEIVYNINNCKSYSNFHIKIDNYIGKTLVKFGWGSSFGRTGATCLFKKGTKEWGKNRVHPKIVFKGKFGPDLNNPINHFFVKDVSELFKKFDSWTYLKSLDIIESNQKETLINNTRRVFSRFLKNYYKKKGYKEGKLGFLISLFAGLYPLISYLRSEINKDK